MDSIEKRVLTAFQRQARSVRVLIDRDATVKARERFSGNQEGIVASFDTSLTLYRVFDGEELVRILRTGKVTGGTYSVSAERAHGASWGEDLSGIIHWGNSARGGRLGEELYIAKLDAFDKTFYHLDPKLPFDPSGEAKQSAMMNADACSLGLGCSVIDVGLNDVELFEVDPQGQLHKLSMSEAKALVDARPAKDVDLRSVNSQLLQGSILGVDVRVWLDKGFWKVFTNDNRQIVSGAKTKEDAIELAQMSIRTNPTRPVPMDAAILVQKRERDKHFEQDANPEKIRGHYGLKPRDILVVEKGSRGLGIDARDTMTVADVYQRKGEREVLVKLVKGAKAWTLYATHPNRLKDDGIVLMNSKGEKIVARLKAKTAAERVAHRIMVAADFLDIGDLVYIGKYKNGLAKIVGWLKDRYGNPMVQLQKVTKDGKPGKLMSKQLFTIWRADLKQNYLAEQAALENSK